VDATEILRHLGGGEDSATEWMDRRRRVWTLLRECYDEVAAAGRFLLRDHKDKERFGSLLPAGRRSRTRRRAVADESAPAADSP